ncbi:MAG: bifunctional folylpolyglutamate synthase/dihydrofolate synthase [Chitinophagales bacterium]
MARFGIKPGLDRIKFLLNCLNNPQDNFLSVHIAGTNGKGSVAAIINSILTAAGYKVGGYSSPHLHSYCERIKINNRVITSEAMVALLRIIEPLTVRCGLEEAGSPTEFEVLTAIAFQYFNREKVDIGVIEAGMGGVHDSTNVINPLVTAITNVAMDHMTYLGTSLEDIAANKAGITKPGMPMVYGDDDPRMLDVLRNEVASRGSTLHLARDLVETKRIEDLGLGGHIVDIKTPRFSITHARYALPGRFQLNNLTTALAALEFLYRSGLEVNTEHVLQGMEEVRWPGRLELVHENPTVIIDAAHNPHGARSIASALNEIFPKRSRILVIGVLDDKDDYGIFDNLSKGTSYCIITRPESERGKNWRLRLETAKRVFPAAIGIEDITEAIEHAMAVINQDDYILITGSFYTIDKGRRMFTKTY